LDRGIRSALRKGEQYAKDGMDLSVCYLSPDKKYVLFGGAMNPISCVQNGELTEIKADKRAIGGEHSENYLFNMHRIDITSPTHFYLYSDGFQDQFGGKENKKFMTKRFRELLLNIHHEEMNVQKDILEKTITDWIGTKNSQLDDILVIGFTVGK